MIDDVVREAAGADRAHPLDDPVRAALLGPHAHLAQRHGDALRYPTDVCPFLAPPATAGAWADAAALAGPGGTAVVPTLGPLTAPGWTVERTLPGVQLVAPGPAHPATGERDGGSDGGPPAPAGDPQPVRLGLDDVDEMLALVDRTRPGPFAARTPVMGTYLGIRDRGTLVAMAGERMHPPGHVEISAVCTDADHRGRGIASRLVRALAAGIRARGATPFLHATADNAGAIRLYEELGFALRARPDFVILRAPGPRDPDGGTTHHEPH